MAHDVDLSVWHEVYGLGILYLSVIAGVMNPNVGARTFTSAMVGSIFWNVASYALAAGRSLFVMCVFFERGGARAVQRHRSVATAHRTHRAIVRSGGIGQAGWMNWEFAVGCRGYNGAAKSMLQQR